MKTTLFYYRLPCQRGIIKSNDFMGTNSDCLHMYNIIVNLLNITSCVAHAYDINIMYFGLGFDNKLYFYLMVLSLVKVHLSTYRLTGGQLYALPSAIANYHPRHPHYAHMSLKPLIFAHFPHDVLRCELVGVKFNREMGKSAKDFVIPKDFMEKDYN